MNDDLDMSKESSECASHNKIYWKGFCKEVYMEMWVYESSLLRGPNVIVKTDESMFGKRKYNRGKRVNGTWVFGGIERGLNRCFLSDGQVEGYSATIHQE
ncbi:putative transposase-like protein [Trichonephila clavipes]|nr:putative transposase-like protein [Trichonephila clavipes]